MIANLQETLNSGKINPALAVASPLKYQTRHVEAFPWGDGYAVTSIEGRCGIKNIDFNNPQEKHKDDFNFWAHRKPDNTVFPVHQAAFNFKFNTFVTVGGDGQYYIWDKTNRKRLKTKEVSQVPMTACAMASDASMMAFALGYDWAAGCNKAHNNTAIFLSPLSEKDCKS